MASQELYNLTASEVSALTRNGTITVEQYARSLISRVRARDSMVKAWAYFNEELILDQAKQLDKVPQSERGLLHGVAIGVKDVIYTKDMPTQFNSPIYKNDTPKVDAASIITLRHAGALIFGKTTTTEFAATTVGPATGNPHDTSRTPGGSSSGSGAAVADFQVPITLGTQTGGSVIRPASFNGVYGFKPTWNSLSREGQKIFGILLDTLGFYARSVEDLEILAEVFRLQDDEVVNEPFAVKGSKIAICKTEIWPQAGEGTRNAIQKAVEILTAHGAEVVELSLPSEFDDFPKYNKRLLNAEGRVSFLPDYYANKDKLDPHLVDLVENKEKITRKQQLEAIDRIAGLRPKFDSIAEGCDVVLTPSVPDEAPEGLGWTGNAAFNAMWTALHVPVVNVPAFKGNHGLPIGVSLVAPRYRDQHLLRIAKGLAKVLVAEGGWETKLLK